ncbi:Lrp/AsnC family transcriptional regulator [Vibrio vulnificus]|nr:Lrp/AsnC family transcriptional regulator [Vibrio vulnificus]EHH2488348.1 Lrp/AsnC family transcriptional regulator [Vibrio vulnificus]EIA1308673.1 Lrp/AsnC family transcriptional regulator [Vibrio vulnificus]ELP6806544.1 Lrp/AsnC family transcriptional regulator [Vibrio vulnificus]ELX4170776.1 Lrp/AsnC family transcriptional regulator [Vibrio vulnificus]
MDKFDKQLLTILRNDARSSVTDMAKAVNLSRSAVTARIKKLESDGVILGYHADIAEEKASEKIAAYLALKFDTSASSHHCEAYAKEIYLIDGVKFCHAISGETDMMLYVEVTTMTRLNQIREQLQAFPELKHVITHTVLTEFFNTTKVSDYA